MNDFHVAAPPKAPTHSLIIPETSLFQKAYS
jgi:hypothetical protein